MLPTNHKKTTRVFRQTHSVIQSYIAPRSLREHSMKHTWRQWNVPRQQVHARSLLHERDDKRLAVHRQDYSKSNRMRNLTRDPSLPTTQPHTHKKSKRTMILLRSRIPTGKFIGFGTGNCCGILRNCAAMSQTISSTSDGFTCTSVRNC